MKCHACPAAGPCVVATSQHVRFCELVDPSHRDYEPGYIAIVERLSAEAPPAPSPPAAAVALPQDPAGIGAMLRKVQACPHRGPAIGCGCQDMRTCSAGRGERTPGEVSTRECLACVTS